jgi:hypothetical protein
VRRPSRERWPEDATRKIAAPPTDAEALEFIEHLAAAPVVTVGLDIIVQADRAPDGPSAARTHAGHTV